MRDALDRLRDAILLRVLDDGGDESYGAMHEGLVTWHEGRGTRQAAAVAARQAHCGWLLGRGVLEAEIGRQLGCSLRTVEGDVRLLRELYAVSPLRRRDRRRVEREAVAA
jgi:DNA-binding CsgD family transcriptional regulator